MKSFIYLSVVAAVVVETSDLDTPLAVNEHQAGVEGRPAAGAAEVVADDDTEHVDEGSEDGLSNPLRTGDCPAHALPKQKEIISLPELKKQQGVYFSI